jgi:hypothetical protein
MFGLLLGGAVWRRQRPQVLDFERLARELPGRRSSKHALTAASWRMFFAVQRQRFVCSLVFVAEWYFQTISYK